YRIAAASRWGGRKSGGAQRAAARAVWPPPRRSRIAFGVASQRCLYPPRRLGQCTTSSSAQPFCWRPRCDRSRGLEGGGPDDKEADYFLATTATPRSGNPLSNASIVLAV